MTIKSTFLSILFALLAIFAFVPAQIVKAFPEPLLYLDFEGNTPLADKSGNDTVMSVSEGGAVNVVAGGAPGHSPDNAIDFAGGF
ncbi:MAG: hypothetical protein VCA55_03235, partial [Verrucomicrobiales bacterium]